MSLDIMQRMQRLASELSPAQRLVARWLAAHPRQAIDLPIAELADRCGVSEPTVIRFCRRLGLTGYRALKTQLAGVSEQPHSFLHQDVLPRDSTGAAVSKVLDNGIRALMDLRATIDSMPFTAAVNRLEQARQVVFIGVGASGRVAADGWHKFFRLGVPCTTATDAPTIAQCAAVARGNDIYLAISHTGRWPQLVEGMKLARGNGAATIAITHPDSALARASELVFPCHATEDTSIYTPMSSRLAQLAVLDALQVAFALRLGAAAERDLRRSKEVLQSPTAEA